jgi:hypothetical protein
MQRAILAAALVLSTPGYARDLEFDVIARRIGERCETSLTQIPFLGVANLLVKIARPSGTSDMKLATFENLRKPLFIEDEDCKKLVGEALGPDWHPLLRVQKPGREEWNCIYASGSGNRWKLLIVNTTEQSVATVLRLRVNAKAIRRWIIQPYQEERNRHRRG